MDTAAFDDLDYSQAKPHELARILIARLERISVDSHWAWRASGMRRSLLRCLAEIEDAQTTESQTEGETRLAELIPHGFMIVESAAREMRNYKE